MTFRFPRILPLVVFLTSFLALTTAVLAQEGEGAEHPGVGLRKARQAVSDEKMGTEGKGSKWASMTPEERLNASIRRDSKGQCRFVATCRPPKLMPGQSGTLLITAILQGAAVLPAPLQMTMIPRNPAGSVTIGDMVPQPAQIGVLAKGYLGRPVYENTAVLKVPVTMGNNAKLGSKQPVAVDLQFDIFDGTSAQVVGRFIERVTTNIEVGQYIDPPVVGRRAKPKTTEPNPVANTTTEPKGASNDANQPKGPDAMGGTPAVVPVGNNISADNPETTEPTGSGDLPPTEADEGGLPLGMMIGGGAFLLAIVLLMMRKK